MNSNFIVVDTSVFTDPNVARDFSGPCAKEDVATWAFKNALIACAKNHVKLVTTSDVWGEIQGFVKFTKDKSIMKLVAQNMIIKNSGPGLMIPAHLMLDSNELTSYEGRRISLQSMELIDKYKYIQINKNNFPSYS